MMEFETRKTSITVVRMGESIYHESATTISITDEAAGEFVELKQAGNNDIRITPEEWPTLCIAIDEMIKECRGNDDSKN